MSSRSWWGQAVIRPTKWEHQARSGFFRIAQTHVQSIRLLSVVHTDKRPQREVPPEGRPEPQELSLYLGLAVDIATHSIACVCLHHLLSYVTRVCLSQPTAGVS